MVHHKKWIILSVVVVTLILSIACAQGEPPAKPGNPGLPGYLAEINRLGQMIAEQNATIEELNTQINTLQAPLDAMKNYAPVPQDRTDCILCSWR
ncbi:MAG TPA: hypothetical protein VLW47_09545 [Thermodesulfobacteriota bacterium]|nr:hypothetical protein [Thermodesulfobacteriota bacterium]